MTKYKNSSNKHLEDICNIHDLVDHARSHACIQGQLLSNVWLLSGCYPVEATATARTTSMFLRKVQ